VNIDGRPIMISIYEPDNWIEINALMAMLEGEGVTAEVRPGEETPTVIWVPEEQAEIAVQLIRDYLKNLPKPEENPELIPKERLMKKVRKIYAWAAILFFVISFVFLFVKCDP
jgi:hypothetical protein